MWWKTLVEYISNAFVCVCVAWSHALNNKWFAFKRWIYLFLISRSQFGRAVSHPSSLGKLRHGAMKGSELGIRPRFAEAQVDVRQRSD